MPKLGIKTVVRNWPVTVRMPNGKLLSYWAPFNVAIGDVVGTPGNWLFGPSEGVIVSLRANYIGDYQTLTRKIQGEQK